MSTYTAEPGTRLAGRYRLEDQVGSGNGWTLWKAIDEILARAVTVLMFDDGCPRARAAVTAARAASRLTDSRLCRVFDVDDGGDCAYIVTEWVAGDSLDDMLSEGPLDPGRAVDLVTEAARALAVAHEAGLAHLRLGPRSLRWTRGGVKITGLGIDAALSDATATDAADAALADTRGLARLLYAAVTGYWPGPEPTTLPPAPVIDGAPCSPRQISAAVPVSVDSVTCRALFQRRGRGASAITTPLAFAEALAGLAVGSPSPVPAPYHGGDRSGAASARRLGDRSGGTWLSDGPAAVGAQPAATDVSGTATIRASAGRRGRRGGGGAPLKALVGVVAVLVLVAIGATAWLVGHQSHTARLHAGPVKPTKPAKPSTAASVVLKPVGAEGFDNNAAARYAIDGNPATYWQTDYYIGNPVFGGLKKGTGLLVDMGTPVRITQVTVKFGPVCCADVELGVGDSPSPNPTAYTIVASTSHAVGTHTFTAGTGVTGRYVLIWFTRLPPKSGSPNEYQAQIYNVVVRGSG